MNIIMHEANGLQIGQRREDGYINLTLMAQASGKLIADYLRLETTKAFLDELSMDMGIPISNLIQIRRGKPAHLQGTWGHPQIAINCATWCSPEFAVLVSKWVFDWITTAQNPLELSKNFSNEFSDAVKAYIESSQALNRTIHTAIHQQSDSLRETLKVLNTGIISPSFDEDDSSENKYRLDSCNTSPKKRYKKYNKPYLIISDEDMAWARMQNFTVYKLWGDCWRSDPYGSRWMPLQTTLGKENLKKAKKFLIEAGLFLFENRMVILNGQRRYEWWVKNLHGARSIYWKSEEVETSNDNFSGYQDIDM